MSHTVRLILSFRSREYFSFVKKHCLEYQIAISLFDFFSIPSENLFEVETRRDLGMSYLREWSFLFAQDLPVDRAVVRTGWKHCASQYYQSTISFFQASDVSSISLSFPGSEWRRSSKRPNITYHREF